MSCKGLIAPLSPGVPHFHHAVFRARHDAERVRSDSPHTFNVAEEFPNASTGFHFP
jgi:hypothetical protein